MSAPRETKAVKEERRCLEEWQAKPCPFCGEQPTCQPWHGGGPRKRMISCDNDICPAMPGVTGSTYRRARDGWNQRIAR